MKRYLLLLFFLTALSMAAQSTVGTGTVSDPTGTTYPSATVSCSIVSSTGEAPTINGSPVTSPVTATANGSGVVSMTLADTSLVRPNGTKWRCQVIAAAGAPEFATTFGPFGPTYTLPFAGAMPPLSSLNYVPYVGAPTGACLPLQTAINNSTGDYYNCLSGAWNKLVAGTGSGNANYTGTQNVVSKGSATAHTLQDGSMTDTGSAPVASPNGLGTGINGGLTQDMPNAATVGTGLNLMACQTVGAYTVQSCATTATDGAVGVAVAGVGTAPGTTGNVSICYGGKCAVKFDNQTTPGDYAIHSTTVLGELHDTGSTTQPNGAEAFQVDSANSGAGTTATIKLLTPDAIAASTTTKVTATAPITATTNGTGVNISTTMPNSDFPCRYSAGTGVLQNCSFGTGLSLSGGGVLSATATGTVSGSGTVGYLPAWVTNTTTLGNSHIDDGVTSSGVLTVSEPFSLGTQVLTKTMTTGTGGVTQYLLTTIDTSNPSRVILPALAAAGTLGIAQTTATVGNPVEVSISGRSLCIADNTVTAGDLVGVGTTTAGRCKDLGVTASNGVANNVQIIGKAYTSASTGSSFTVSVIGPGHYGTLVVAAGTNSSVCSDNSCTQNVSKRTACITDLAPVTGDDGLVTILNPYTAVHITRFSCGVTGTTSVIANLVKGGNSLIADATCTAGDANQVVVTTFANGSSQCGGTSSCAVAAHAPVTIHIGTISGTPTGVTVCTDYTVD